MQGVSAHGPLAFQAELALAKEQLKTQTPPYQKLPPSQPTSDGPGGAELRGTGPRVWRGMAPGTCKDRGYFWVGLAGSRQIILCESAIDAMSCFQMNPQRICISTSGVRADPPWLRALLARDYELYCGFDADQPGDTAAERMIALHPAVKRLRPPAHDWNDVLASRR